MHQNIGLIFMPSVTILFLTFIFATENLNSEPFNTSYLVSLNKNKS